MRIMGYGNLEIYEPDPLLFWRLQPNQDCYTKIDHKPVHVNSRGTRGPEFDVPKPPGTLRILMLGDSRTFGWGLSGAETYSGLVEVGLQKALAAQRKVEVINCGVNAWSYSQMHVFFRERALAWQPDIVVLADANLWTQFSEKNSPEFVKQFMWRVRLKNLLRRFALYHFVMEVQLKDFYEKHRTKFIPVDPKQDTLFKEQQQSDPDAFFRDAIQGLCDTAKSNGVQAVLCHLPTQRELESGKPEDNVLQAKQEVAAKSGVPLADLTPDLKPRAKELYLDGDPIHLNVAGNEIIAKKLLETLTPLAKP